MTPTVPRQAAGTGSRRLRIDDLYVIEVPEDPTLSPDGQRIVYVLAENEQSEDRTARRLWQVGVDDAAPRQLTSGPGDQAPSFSPDGSTIAFLRNVDGAPAQVWTMPSSGGEAVQLTSMRSGAGRPTWSPDGRRIAFTASVGPDEPDSSSSESSERVAPPVVTDRLDYKADGGGLRGNAREHLHVVDVPQAVDVSPSGVRQLTSGDWDVSSHAWSPDGSKIALVAARAPDADLSLRDGLYLCTVADPPLEPERVGTIDGFFASITWSSDASALFVAGAMTSPTHPAGLLRIPLDGQSPVDLVRELDRTVMVGQPAYPGATPQLADDGESVLVCARDRGCTQLYVVGGAGLEPPRHLVGGRGANVAGASAAAGVSHVALVLATPTSFGEVATVALRTGETRVLTHHGEPLMGEVELFERVEREFRISDGTTVHGWLVRDPAATGPQPLLLDIHGGPHNAWHGGADDVHLYQQELVARGWTVLLLNPRGSDGYGRAFYLAAIDGWGQADERDFLEPLDELVTEGTADPSRLAVTGYSYGGYMTCYLTTRTSRFSAAVAGGSLTDLVSAAGTSDAGHYLATHEHGISPWCDEVGELAASPMSSVRQVVTPTLLLHGEADERCPVGQAEQWFTALRVRGVPTRLVVYPGGSHLFPVLGAPSHRVDYNRRVVDWVTGNSSPTTRRRRPAVEAKVWERRLAELAAMYGVPGAALGVLRVNDGVEVDLVRASVGVLNTGTGVEVTDDSAFQIGSITKLWTATLAMQLVDEGELDLDTPVVKHLPDLKLSTTEATSALTIRHLLTHTSGIDGDVFVDTGRGDDCLERYVERLADVPQIHPVGTAWSYSNAAFVVAGRVIEGLTGMTWDEAVRSRLVARLGLAGTVTLPEDALLLRVAVGHATPPDGGGPRPHTTWMLPRSVGPAGLITSTVGDVLTFARVFLNRGTTQGGDAILSPAALETMLTPQADVPGLLSGVSSTGVAWGLRDWDGVRVAGHDGGTIGQQSYLRLCPDAGLAVVLLTNGGASDRLYHSLFGDIFHTLAGVDMPDDPVPPAQPPRVDVSECVGRYERTGSRIEVLENDGGLLLRSTTTGFLASLFPDETEERILVPVTDDKFLAREREGSAWTPVTFYTLAGQRYVHVDGRAAPRRTTSP